MLVDIVNGFLGSGKTTLIQNLVAQLIPLERVVILVNEFGEIGIDGILLAGDDLDVVELTSGCVCCTLAADMGRQLQKIATRLKPDRVIIEPTGVATIQGVMAIVGSLRLEKYVKAVKVVLMLDAAEMQNYGGDYPAFFESQITRADVVIINKCDMVPLSAVSEIRKWISTVNRRSRILETKFGKVSLEQMDAPPVSSDLTGGGGENLHHQHHHDRYIERNTPGYRSFSREYREVFDKSGLEYFFLTLKNLMPGEVIRAKGIFRCAEGFIRVDYVPASGVTVSDLGDGFKNSRVLIIGHDFIDSELDKKLQACLASSISIT